MMLGRWLLLPPSLTTTRQAQGWLVLCQCTLMCLWWPPGTLVPKILWVHGAVLALALKGLACGDTEVILVKFFPPGMLGLGAGLAGGGTLWAPCLPGFWLGDS